MPAESSMIRRLRAWSEKEEAKKEFERRWRAQQMRQYQNMMLGNMGQKEWSNLQQQSQMQALNAGAGAALDSLFGRSSR